MKSIYFLFFFLLITAFSFGQSPYKAALPERLMNLEEAVVVNHFPNPVYACTDEDRPGLYFWKHNTSLLSETEDLTVIEGGAFLFYNDKWNLRVAMSPKEFSKLYGIKRNKIKAGQPYTYVDNWRSEKTVWGGWAMWYVIAEKENGQKVYGRGILELPGETFKSKK